jgi:hypothetical protein
LSPAIARDTPNESHYRQRMTLIVLGSDSKIGVRDTERSVG